MIKRVQFGGIVCANRIVQAVPQFCEFAASINDDARTGITRIGVARAIAINTDIKPVRGMGSPALAAACNGTFLFEIAVSKRSLRFRVSCE